MFAENEEMKAWIYEMSVVIDGFFEYPVEGYVVVISFKHDTTTPNYEIELEWLDKKSFLVYNKRVMTFL